MISGSTIPIPGPRYDRSPPPRVDRDMTPRQSYPSRDQPPRQTSPPHPPRSPMAQRRNDGCYVCGRFGCHSDFHIDQRPPTPRYDQVPTHSPRSTNPFQDERVEEYRRDKETWETVPGLRCRATGVPVVDSNVHFPYRSPTSGFGTWGSPALGKGSCTA